MCFLQEYVGLVILKLLDAYTKIEQISKYIDGSENQVAHCQKEVTNRQERRLKWTLWCCVGIGSISMSS